MGRIKLKLKDWPFVKGQKVQLIWIGEPFKQNNKWMIDTYFCDGKETKKIIQDWANIHFLSIDKYYVDGDLNSGQIKDANENMKIIDIDLSRIKPSYYENEWNIRRSNFKGKSRTFNFYKDKVLYSIPVIEIVRAVLAPNTFMLNTILYNDIYENYYTYEYDTNAIKIYFTNQYRKSYLKSEYYNHLAWIISNKDVLNTINSIGFNMLNNKLEYDFKLELFKIQARVKKNRSGYSIVEIIKILDKKINAKEIVVYHPSFEEAHYTQKAKLRTYHKKDSSSDRVIDNSVDGSTNSDESVDTDIIKHEYAFIPKVKKEKTGHRDKRADEDENTKKYILDSDNSRSLADSEGLNLVKGIEMSNVDLGQVKGELKEFIDILNKLKYMSGISSVEISIVQLPLGRKFSYLNDGVTRRKCVISKIITIDGKEHSLIEIEREEKSLSLLIITTNGQFDWQYIYKNILEGVVKECGRWSIGVINSLQEIGVEIYRSKHIAGRLDNIIQKIRMHMIR